MAITKTVRNGNTVLGASLAALSVFATDSAAFESQIWPGSLPAASVAISVKTSNPVEGSLFAVEGWIQINYAISVDCSPPRACYANSQWVYVYTYCPMGTMREIRRVSLDLNGNVLAETGERAAYIPARGSVDRAVVRSLCEVYGFNFRNLWRGRGVDADADD